MNGNGNSYCISTRLAATTAIPMGSTILMSRRITASSNDWPTAAILARGIRHRLRQRQRTGQLLPGLSDALSGHRCGIRPAAVGKSPGQWTDGGVPAARDFRLGRCRGVRGPAAGESFLFLQPLCPAHAEAGPGEIFDAHYQAPRPMRLFFYYPYEETEAFLTHHPNLVVEDVIDCRDLFDEDDDREKILVLRLRD